ncbi:hypothetical protein M405DRAFT_93915 [Rhizopogon salebrosus TDB-379]|nr:hypothetical protein M405DRAFT_93915 [Rhizopogon salebrosus TDB-379]
MMPSPPYRSLSCRTALKCMSPVHIGSASVPTLPLHLRLLRLILLEPFVCIAVVSLCDVSYHSFLLQPRRPVKYCTNTASNIP